jgi:hypothetical protein
VCLIIGAYHRRVELIAKQSPRLKARLAGLFYVLTAATSVFGQSFVLSKLVVEGDPTATAIHILAHEPFFRLGFAVLILSMVFSLAMTVLFYELFKPVSRTISLLAAFIHLVGLAIMGFGSLLQLFPLVILGGGQYLRVFQVGQLQSLAYMSLQFSAQAFDAFIVFFGFYCVLVGYLIFKSTFLPRIVGVLMALAGLGYLTFLAKPLANYLAPYNLFPAALGEISLMLWPLIVGVNVQRWNERLAAATEPAHT